MEYQKLVEEIFKKHNLTPVGKGVVRGEKVQRAFVTRVTDAKGRKLFFKMLLVEKKVDRDDFLAEENFLRIVKERKEFGLAEFVPALVLSNTEKMPFWVVEEWVKGEPAGDITLDFGFKEKFLTIKRAERVVAFLRTLHAISHSQAAPLLPWVEKPEAADYYLGSFRVLDRAVEKWISPKILKEIQKSFFGNLKLLSTSKFIAHSDLYPKNVFWQKDKLTVIDWDHAIWTNNGLDLGFFWSMGWKNPAWQEALVRNYLKTLKEEERKNFLMLFNLMVIYLGVRLISHGMVMIPKWEKHKRPDLVKIARESIRAHKANVKRALVNLASQGGRL